MDQPPISRRAFVGNAARIAGPAALAAALPAAAAGSAPPGAARLRILCVGGHPDDPESACGGALALYSARGHAVTIAYLTRGERGIPGRTLGEAAAIRTREAEAACRLLGAKAVFLGQIDGEAEVTRSRVERVTRLFDDERPDVVFTHWPVDRHMDHQAASMLVQRAWLEAGCKSALFFFEVNAGAQTRGFFPNAYADVSPVWELKKAALLAHVSQKGDEVWREHHEPMARWRGRELGVDAAEAFVRIHSGPGAGRLPGLGA